MSGKLKFTFLTCKLSFLLLNGNGSKGQVFDFEKTDWFIQCTFQPIHPVILVWGRYVMGSLTKYVSSSSFEIRVNLLHPKFLYVAK